MATKKSAKAAKPVSKKEFKKEIAGKIESAIPELKTKLGNKEFMQRSKKAAKILMHGLHSKDVSNLNGKPKPDAEGVAKKSKTSKKVKAKKQMPKPEPVPAPQNL